MNLQEKLELFKNKGFRYEPETGCIYSHKNKIVAGKTGSGYVCCGININGKIIKIGGHQLAWYLSHNELPNVIDHIDKNRSNNKLNNLRNITHQKNSFNTSAKGYSYNKRDKKYEVKICIDGNLLFLGYFLDEDEARKAYLNAKSKYHII
jgi:hypothetical protein